MAKKKFYAVRKGVTPGVYQTWDECKAQVDGFSGAEYKSFSTPEEAMQFVFGEYERTQNVSDKIQEDGNKKLVSSVTKYSHVDIDSDVPYSFVDGSFNPETSVYGYGGFLCVGDMKYPISGSGNDPQMASMRNVAGEISGAMAAVKKAEELGIREMTMFYDYRGIEDWANGAWKAKNPCTAAYASFMNSDNRSVQVKFQHVKGHTGIEGNEMADVMAKNAVGIPLTRSQKMLLEDVLPPSTVRPDRRLPSGVEDMTLQSASLNHGVQFGD